MPRGDDSNSEPDTDGESDSDGENDSDNEDDMKELIPRGEEYDSNSDLEDEDDDESRHNEESISDNNPNGLNTGTHDVENAVDCDDSGITIEDQGADGNISGGDGTPTRERDGVIVEEITEEKYIRDDVIDPSGPTTRSRTRSGQIGTNRSSIIKLRVQR